jgi:hypothetical protein
MFATHYLNMLYMRDPTIAKLDLLFYPLPHLLNPLTRLVVMSLLESNTTTYQLDSMIGAARTYQYPQALGPGLSRLM